MKLNQFITSIVLIVLTFFVSAQKQDFNEFQTLRSKGPIPADFNTSTQQKIDADLATRRENFTPEEQKDFTERIHQSVDELLQSGKIIYGDEISNFVAKVAKNLLKDDLDLYNELRFYTVKSNITNALSTDQGIILVTTGLISQLTSEAELAYVLAHEIIHYKEKHAMEWFEFTKNEDVINKMKEMSIHSQDREFEADVKGIDMYLKAGYSKDHLTVLFDVLAYSYLPIDEIPFPDTYFNTAICEIPKKKFPTEKYDIKLDENYDDRRSTHPNIKRRKTKALETADTLENWGDLTYTISLDEFYYVRNIARFERLRSDMLDKSYDHAIYTIFILESSFPESLYLTRMKCQAWNGLSALKAKQRDNLYEYEGFGQAKDFGLEGEIATFQKFLKNLSKIEIATLAARVVEDCRKQYPEDGEISELWNRTMKLLVTNRKFDLEDYSDVTYNEYLKNAEKESDSLNSMAVTEADLAKMTKYQKIRNKRKVAEQIKVLDSTNYYLYNISDLITDDNFLAVAEKYKDGSDDDLFDNFYDDFDMYDDYELSRKERKALKKERKRNEDFDSDFGTPVDLSELVVIDPYVAYYEDKKIDAEKSDDLQATLKEAFDEISIERGLNTYTIGRGNLTSMTTEQFNQKCMYVSLLEQLNNYRSKNTFPVDYSEIMQLEKDEENRKVVFVALINNLEEPDYSYKKKTLKSRIKKMFKTKNTASMYLVILDPKQQKILFQESTFFKKGKTKSDIREQLEKLLDTKVEEEKEIEESGLDEALEETISAPKEEKEIIEEEIIED